MMKFSYQYDENSPKIEMTMHPDMSLPDVLQEFEHFLKACGYGFKGQVDILDDPDFNPGGTD